VEAYYAFYDNNESFRTVLGRISALTSLLYQHHKNRSKPEKSILNKIGFNEENIKHLLEAIFNPQLIDRRVSANELIQRGDNLTQKFLYDFLFNGDDSVPADQILKKAYQLSKMTSCFPEFLNFNFDEAVYKAVTFSLKNPNAELPKEILDALPVQEAGNTFTFDAETVNYISHMTGQQNAPATANVTAPSAGDIAAASRPLTQVRQPEPEEEDIDIQALRAQPDLKEAIRLLDDLVLAFKAEPEDYESKLMDHFGGKSRIQLRKEINAKFPAKNLGSALMTYRQGDQHADILVIIADRFGINGTVAFAEKINEICEALKGDYPDAFKDAEADKAEDPFKDIDPNNVAPINQDDLDDLFNS